MEYRQGQLKHQRSLANSRERKRMMLINEGFELLKSKLPSFCLGREMDSIHVNESRWIRARRSRLTKCDILRLAIEYIRYLGNILDDPVAHRDYRHHDLHISRLRQVSRAAFHRQRPARKDNRLHRRRCNFKQVQNLSEPTQVFTATTRPANLDTRQLRIRTRLRDSNEFHYCMLSCAWRQTPPSREEDKSRSKIIVESRLWIPDSLV